MMNPRLFARALVLAPLALGCAVDPADLVDDPALASSADAILGDVGTAALLQGPYGCTLVAGRTSALRVHLASDALANAVRRVEVTVVRPDGSSASLTFTGTSVRVVPSRAAAPALAASVAVRIPGSVLPFVGDYHLRARLLDGAGVLLGSATLDGVNLLETRDLRLAVDRIWSGTETKPNEVQAAFEGLSILSRLYPVRDGVAPFDGARTAGVRYVYNNNPQPTDSHLGPFFDAWRNRGAGRDSADVGIAYRFPNVGEGSGANANHNHNGLPFNVIVWGAPLGWVFSHETAHNLGMVPAGAPRSDGTHSTQQFLTADEALRGYDPVRHRAFSETMFDVMYPSGSGNEDSYGFNPAHWELLRQRLLTLPSTGPTGPATPWSSLAGTSLQAKLAVGTDLDGRREVFVIGGDGALYARWETSPGGAWSGWAYLGGTGLTGPVRASRLGDGRLAVFVRGADARVSYRAQSAPGGGWLGWQGLGLTTVRNFVVAQNVDTRAEVLAISDAGNLQSARQTAPAGGFAAWQNLGGNGFTGEIAAARNVDGRLQVFAVGPFGVAYERRQTAANATAWTPFASLYAPSMPVNAELRAETDGLGQVELFARDASGAIFVRTQSGPGGAMGPVVPLWGSQLRAGYAVARGEDGRLEVFAVGGNGLLYARSQVDPARPGVWFNWRSLGATPLQSALAVANGPAGRLDFFTVASGELLRGARAGVAPVSY